MIVGEDMSKGYLTVVSIVDQPHLWLVHETNLTGTTFKLALLVQPSSAAAESIFTVTELLHSATVSHALEETSIMLQ